MKYTVIATVAAAMLASAGAANAAEHVVEMLNKGEKGSMVFQPAYVKAAVGDTVRFVPTDKSHNAESIKGMLPEGAEAFKGKTNAEVVVTLPTNGIYGVKCAPHYGMGMVALIDVGEPVNDAAAKAVKQSGKAKTTFAALFEQADAN